MLRIQTKSIIVELHNVESTLRSTEYNKLTKLNAQHIYILFKRQIDIHAKEFGGDIFFSFKRLFVTARNGP